MKRKIISRIMLLLLLISMLLASFEIGEASASSKVRIYVEMHAQSLLEIPIGEIFNVTVRIESPSEWRNTSNGIVGWAFDVHVDPDVLEPITVEGATNGYFLYDFAYEHGYFADILFRIDKEAGLLREAAEFIFGWEALGVGAGGDGKLCDLLFRLKSQTNYTQIDLYDIAYYTTTGKYLIETVGDGQYNSLDSDYDTLGPDNTTSETDSNPTETPDTLQNYGTINQTADNELDSGHDDALVTGVETTTISSYALTIIAIIFIVAIAYLAKRKSEVRVPLSR